MRPCPRCSRTIEEGAECPACNPKRTGLDELEALRKEHRASVRYLRACRYLGNDDAFHEFRDWVNALDESERFMSPAGRLGA